MDSSEGAHISFAPSSNPTQPQMYEIVIGGWNNTRSIIRKRLQDGSVRPLTLSDPEDPFVNKYPSVNGSLPVFSVNSTTLLILKLLDFQCSDSWEVYWVLGLLLQDTGGTPQDSSGERWRDDSFHGGRRHGHPSTRVELPRAIKWECQSSCSV